MRSTLFAGIGVSILMSGSALADVGAMAATDLNVRAGPGTEFQVVGMLGAGQPVAIRGCMEASKWCVVDTGSGDGWVYSDYLVADVSGSQVVITERPAALAVPTVTYDGPSASVPAAVGGAIAGAVIAGPVGAVVGGVLGATAGAAVDPPTEVRTYVTGHPVDPVYLDGEVVVGATLPESVQLVEVPDYQYRYVYVNGVPVLVDAGTRQVVHIVR
jgi:uncharacterized protein YraI